MKKRNCVIVAIVAREILVNYEIRSNAALYAAQDLWDAYVASRDGEFYPGQSGFCAACFAGYFPRRGAWGSASLLAKSSHLETGLGSLFIDLLNLARGLDEML